jgi:hypothetical protein
MAHRRVRSYRPQPHRVSPRAGLTGARAGGGHSRPLTSGTPFVSRARTGTDRHARSTFLAKDARRPWPQRTRSASPIEMPACRQKDEAMTVGRRRRDGAIGGLAVLVLIVGCAADLRGTDVALARRCQELRLILARMKQEAIQTAIDVYRIDARNVSDGVNYSPHGDMEEREGVTIRDTDGRIRVVMGDDAFTSAAWLASSLGHELEVHVNRQLARGIDYPAGDAEGTAIQEVEAYDYELRNKDRFRLSAGDVRLLERRRRTFYERLQPENRQRVDAGVYRKL